MRKPDAARTLLRLGERGFSEMTKILESALAR
jgi:hypothetical protein